MGGGASVERLEVIERDAPQTGKDRPLWQRGVTVEWLVDFTNANNCWDLRTWEVCDQVVKPACNGVCRYVELESVESTGCVGHCDVFVSHTWGANFGNLVAAVVSVVPRSWRVWIDIFAVLQFPGGGLDDLRFDEVVKRSRGCLLVVSPDKDVLAIDPMQILNNKNAIRPDQRAQIPFLRIWCLLEINEALRLHVPLIVLAGERKSRDNGAFKSNFSAGMALSLLVDVEKAEAKFEDDRVRILNLVLETSTFAAVNDAVRGAVTGSTYSTHYPELIQASLGNEVLDGFDLTQRRGHDGTTPLDAACALGIPKLVIELIERGADVNAKSSDGRTSLMLAAFGGKIEVGRILVEKNADIQAADNAGNSALNYALIGKQVECVHALLSLGISVEAGPITSALTLAVIVGIEPAVDALLGAGADPSAKGYKRHTPVECAVYWGRPGILRLLLAAQAQLSPQDKEAFLQDVSDQGFASKERESAGSDIEKIRECQDILRAHDLA